MLIVYKMELKNFYLKICEMYRFLFSNKKAIKRVNFTGFK